MALMQITVIPLGTSGAGVGDFIADIEQYLRDRHIEHSLNDMATVIYGTPEELFRIAREIHSLPFKKDIDRVVTQLTIDDRRDLDRKIDEKKRSVLARLQEQ